MRCSLPPLLVPLVLLVLLVLAVVPVTVIAEEVTQNAGAQQIRPGTEQQRQAVAARLRGKAAIAGEFRQTKTDVKLPRPLQSEGHFVFWRGQGVHWATTSPLEQQTVYRPDATWQMDAGPSSARQLNSRSDRVFRNILLDILSFDEAKLTGDFQPQWQFTPEEQWRLKLTPLRGHLARAIEQVVMSGQEHIDRIEIVDTRGGALVLEFQAQHSDFKMTAHSCESLFLYSAQQCQQQLTP